MPGQISYELAVLAALDAEDRADAYEAAANPRMAAEVRHQAAGHRRRAEHIRHSFSIDLTTLEV